MRTITLLLFFALFGFDTYCQNNNYPIEINMLDSGIYLYESFGDYNGNKISANGIIAVAKDSVVIIDAPWNNEQTVQLIDWVETEIGKPIAMFVITHAHDDRIGGISVLNERKIKSVSSHLTKVYALKRGFESPTKAFERELTMKFDSLEVQIYYPGAGHTVDNSVVYLLPSNILYGGCFIKSSGSTSLGNIEDADLNSWPQSIKNMQKRFPKPKIVIPGHGDYEKGAIENTLKLLGYN